MAGETKGTGIWIGIGVLWVICLVVGHRAMLAYDYSAGAEGVAPASWPAAATIQRTDGMAEILVFAHPKCPCTRATIEELAELMVQVQGQAVATVVFVRPEGVPKDWEKTDIWRSAARIPGVTTVNDPQGIEASRFGAMASGQTLLYGSDGTLRFSGGITAFRGHIGDNAGRTAIASLITTGHAKTNHTSVYGCSLKNPERAEK